MIISPSLIPHTVVATNNKILLQNINNLPPIVKILIIIQFVIACYALFCVFEDDIKRFIKRFFF